MSYPDVKITRFVFEMHQDGSLSFRGEHQFDVDPGMAFVYREWRGLRDAYCGPDDHKKLLSVSFPIEECGTGYKLAKTYFVHGRRYVNGVAPLFESPATKQVDEAYRILESQQ